MNKLVCVLFVAVITSGSAWSAQGGMRGSSTPIVMHPDTGSDAWGYTWFRSDEPGGPTFRWVDIMTRGTLVNGLTDDNVVGPFDMLFNFRYYWYTVNRFKVGSNGYISFDNTTTASAPPFAPFPSTSLPNDLMSICVGDLCESGQAGAGGTVRYWTNGVDSLVVSFLDVTEWESVIIPANTHTFQIILNKADSSITYQYGPQRGRYNTTNNTRLVIGIENATGQIGHQYVYSTTPPHALMPDSGLAIKIKRVVVTWEEWPDAGIVGGFNSENLAKIMRTGVVDTIKCVVKNYGTNALANVRVRYAMTKTGLPSAFDTVIVPSLTFNQEATVTFPRLFTPVVEGTYSALFNVTVPNDVAHGNDNKTAEILSASFGVGQSTLIRYENGIEAQNWPVDGGFGVAIDLPPEAYPALVETVYVRNGTVTTQPMTVEILDGSSGVPGTILATRTVDATAYAMNAIVFTADNVVISGGRFFIGARGNMQFAYEVTAPISYRTWEYSNGWSPYSSRDTRDIIIRASVRGVTTDVKQVSDVLPSDFALTQNYPNPFNPATKIGFRVAKFGFVSLKVFDILGREVATLVKVELKPGAYEATFSANDLASGIYLCRLQAGGFVQTKKLLLQK